MEVRDFADLFTSFAAMGAFLVSVLNRNKIQLLHLEVNHRLTEMLTLTETASHAKGMQDGRSAQKNEDSAPN